MASVYTVRQLNSYIRNMFTQDYVLRRIYVKGEISNCKYHTSGHIYFSLKDESGTVACVMFAGQRGGLSFRMREGMQVIVLGSVSVYERTGSYQLYAKEIRLDGEGALYERFQTLKKELEEMGMFSPIYKKPIPKYAHKVGIVTAPTGAAIRDIINIGTRRNPYVQLILRPAQVQGEGAAESIAAGIRDLESYGVDVIIAGRGGGSIEDLWAFNEEIVARAIFNCSIPVISAVGHETDTTIADFVADLRAPTPSAAAELAVWDWRQFAQSLSDYQNTLRYLMQGHTERSRMRLKQYSLKIRVHSPTFLLQQKQNHLAELSDRLRKDMQDTLTKNRHRLAIESEKLSGHSPLLKLSQGYAFAQTEEAGKDVPVKSIRQVKNGDRIDVYVRDGRIMASVEDTVEERYESDHR